MTIAEHEEAYLQLCRSIAKDCAAYIGGIDVKRQRPQLFIPGAGDVSKVTLEAGASIFADASHRTQNVEVI